MKYEFPFVKWLQVASEWVCCLRLVLLRVRLRQTSFWLRIIGGRGVWV